ncbi:L-aspartate oxidase [Hyphomonas sp. FCG-A18]|uniref:L-aspartate oxidase n=1 Tax=Hyphomonas sp. FCG-A18 TaxID=3080019 RepID=UPI002B28BC96|nr:L-aspartate oxidase [Hyphomonas sp. FCG-A18]
MTTPLEFRAAPPAGDGRILIVGAGLAGLFLALRLAPHPCTIISPAPLGEAASSAWAQGGLAAALHPEDSPEQHAADTIAAGAGLVDPVIARLIAEQGPSRVRDLIELGVPFDRTPDGQLALSLEAAHSQPRVARVAGDLAGKAIMGALTAAVRAASHIQLIEHAKAVGLLQDDNGRIAGAILRDKHDRHSTFTANETVLCTGGSGGLFRVTTNPPQSRGDALAMAYDAGAVIADPEFVQFHPTAMDVGLDPSPLATEALRGEGAILTHADGTAFMANYHDKAELAPRDEVARAIHSEIAAGRPVYLDTRPSIGAHIQDHFPTVFSACMAAGIDPRDSLIPVAPAMHYHMGGILSDTWGKSSLNGLSVCGECASTGAHGANRLASNSLLEAVVFAARIADRLKQETLKSPGESVGYVPTELPDPALQTLRSSMAEHCGVVRNAKGLETLLSTIDRLEDQYGSARALTAARLIASAALQRTESRGGHFRADFKDTSETAQRTFVIPGEPLPQTSLEAIS